MLYPLSLSFKVLAPQIYVRDSNDSLVFFVKEMVFKSKEEVVIFADVEQTTPIYKIKADRRIRWSARFAITDTQDTELGSVKRHGMRSLWRAYYDIFDQAGTLKMHIREANPFIRLLDGLVTMTPIPFIGSFMGLILKPAYNVIDENGDVVMRLRKHPSFFNRKFSIEQGEGALTENDEKLVVLSLLTMILIERNRE